MVEIDPANVDFVSRRGYCYKVSGASKKAMADFDKAIILAPDEHQHYGNRGQLHLDLKEYKAAFEDYNKAVELTQMRNPKYVNNRGWASLQLGNSEDACKDFTYASEHGNPVSKINIDRYCNK